ncbi:low-density lipoprotein receptor-related protein [Plakobranchus ocellatus]|uniref:Low-density lipoprotein receptor-related protein n=1 Tax=Plakobranchus ocellatus TaxID=259542 RepID=A0AAV4BRS9_9GAST|nr:low-density lipoprotein receptor-related protein [Plakobranchus ocellatus]
MTRHRVIISLASGRKQVEECKQSMIYAGLENLESVLFCVIHPRLMFRGVGSTVACESALRSAGTPLSRVRAPLPAPWPDGGPESLRSPCCGLAIYKKLTD